MHQYQRTDYAALKFKRIDGEMHRSLGQTNQMRRVFARLVRSFAGKFRWKSGGTIDQFFILIADSQSQKPFILGSAQQKRVDPAAFALLQQFGQRFLDGAVDQAGTDVHIAHCPAQGQSVHQRHHSIGQDGQGNCQRNDKPERKVQRPERKTLSVMIHCISWWRMICSLTPLSP